MTSSINQPWAISDKQKKRYGKTWATMDFEINRNVYESTFLEDPMNVEIGSLFIAGKTIKMRYKHLLGTQQKVSNSITERITNSNNEYVIDIANQDFTLSLIEVKKLKETLQDAINVIQKRYVMGLYL
jgi:hypothetical protein